MKESSLNVKNTGRARSKVQEGAAYKVQEGTLYKVQSPFFREIFQKGVAYKVQSEIFFNFLLTLIIVILIRRRHKKFLVGTHWNHNYFS